MKATVNEQESIDCGLRESICPAVFERQEDVAEIIADPVPKAEKTNCREAAGSCPVNAVDWRGQDMTDQSNGAPAATGASRESATNLKSIRRAGGAYWIRTVVQCAFVLGSIFTGLQFHRFVCSLAIPEAAAVVRPAAVDAWLPISSFTSLVYLLKSGVANPVHPAGLVIFVLTLLLAFLMGRGFCSWVCPVGTGSEWLHTLGALLFGRNLRMPIVLDWLLRSLKYLLLAFFLVMIGRMSVEDLRGFIYSPYHRICDLKMYALFANVSSTTLTVVATLMVLSLLFKNFWCRYLCPYGALLGVFSGPGLLSIRRNVASCIDCGACTRGCPNRIDVQRAKVVRSPECTACLACTTACPVPQTLRFGSRRGKLGLTPLVYAIITVAALLLVPQLFRALGYWETDTTANYYRRFSQSLNAVAHPPVK